MNWKHWLSTAGCLLALLAPTFTGCTRVELTPEIKAPQADEASVGAKANSPVEKLDPLAPWPMFGGTPARNMVNTTDTNTPVTFSDKDGKLIPKHVKWVADLGQTANGGPVIADGKVFVSTNNKNPRDKKALGPKAILMAFNESDGKFLWQIAHDMSSDERFQDALHEGLCSTPVVEAKRLFYVTPTCEVICADTAGKVQWTYDMMKELKVIPYHLGNCSPLVVGDLVMIVTSNGVDGEGKLAAPKAPSFIAVHKKTGKLVWQSSLPGENIIEGQWSNPAVAIVNGKTQVIFPGGDCIIYGLEPETGKLIWKCNCNPTRKKKGDREMDNYMVSTPIVVGDRLYVGLGVYPEHPQKTRFSYFVCLDITKKGDVSLKSYDVKDAANKDSALVWAFGGPIQPPPAKGRQVYFTTTISTAAVHDGLVYIPEEAGYLNCLDAKTGQRYWAHDFKEQVWGSPYCVDGKVYVGTEGGDIVVFAQGKKAAILATNSVEEAVHSTPIIANGILYVATKSKLYAIR
jgi:outer membrane protein assembly factor BamB